MSHKCTTILTTPAFLRIMSWTSSTCTCSKTQLLAYAHPILPHVLFLKTLAPPRLILKITNQHMSHTTNHFKTKHEQTALVFGFGVDLRTYTGKTLCVQQRLDYVLKNLKPFWAIW